MKISLLVAAAFILFSCSKKVSETVYNIDNTVEATQQIGEAMAAIDESGGTITGDITKINSYEKTFVRLSNDKEINQAGLLNHVLPKAHATTCATYNFGSCASNQKVRNLTGCTTTAGGSISGVVTLTFAGSGAASCTIPANSDSVTRIPNIGINGLRGAIFGINSTAGQVITRTGPSSFTYADSGTRRRFVGPNGTTLLDATSTTSGTMTITGNARSGRTLSGGAIRVVNNLNSVSCEFAPTSVAWTTGCNCPTAGTWTSTCSDSSTHSVDFTSTCGQVTVTKDGVVSTATLDRCE